MFSTDNSQTVRRSPPWQISTDKTSFAATAGLSQVASGTLDGIARRFYRLQPSRSQSWPQLLPIHLWPFTLSSSAIFSTSCRVVSLFRVKSMQSMRLVASHNRQVSTLYGPNTAPLAFPNQDRSTNRLIWLYTSLLPR